jgi:hypothetical protein
MKYINPQEQPNRWLAAVMVDLLEQDTEESRTALTLAIHTLSNSIEPGLVDQWFAPWISQYMELLEKHEKNHSNEVQQCLPADPQEQSQQS